MLIKILLSDEQKMCNEKKVNKLTINLQVSPFPQDKKFQFNPVRPIC